MATVKFMVQPFNLRPGRFNPISLDATCVLRSVERVQSKDIYIWQPLATRTNRMDVGESGIFGAAWYESACGAYFLRPSQACTQYENMDTRNCFATLWRQMSCNTWQLPISADQQTKIGPKKKTTARPQWWRRMPEQQYLPWQFLACFCTLSVCVWCTPALFMNTCPAFNCSELHNARMAIPPSVGAWGPPTKPTKPTTSTHSAKWG